MVHVALQRVLLLLGGYVLGLQRGADGFRGALELALDLVDPALQLEHVRIVRLVGLQLVLVLAQQLGALLAKALDRRVRQDLWGAEIHVLGGAPTLLRPDAIGLGGREGGVEGAQIGRVQ